MYIVVKYQIDLHSLWNRLEKLALGSLLLPISKARTNKLYIFRHECMYIVYL